MSLDSDYDAGREGRGRAPVTTIALAGYDASAHEEIKAALAQIPEPLVELIELAGGDSNARKRLPEIVIVTLGDDEESWAVQIQEIRQGSPRGAVIAAIAERAGGKVRLALRAGADDVFFLLVEPSDLSRCLVRACETLQGGRARSATICSITSVAGGVGASSLAIALGFALRRQAATRVGLIDLNLQCGTLAAILDLAPESTISELVDPTSTIDSLRMESSLVAHKSGLYLLAAPKRIEESEMVSVNTVAAVLGVMRELFDFILIDCGHHMDEALIAAWEQSTHLLYVVQQSVSSVRPAQRFLEMFERLPLTELDLQFVLNRYDPASPFAEEKIATALRRPIAARVPRDDAAFLQFQLECADLAPKSPCRLAIDELAAHLSGIQRAPAAAKAQPFFARMRAALNRPAGSLLKPSPGRNLRRAVKPSPADI